MSIEPETPLRDRTRAFLCLVLISIVWVAAPLGCAHQRGSQGSVLVIEVQDDHLDAQVYVDGNYVGNVLGLRSAGPPGGVSLAPGVHRVEVRKPGHFPVQRTVRVDNRPPATTVVHAELLEDPR